MSEPHFLATNGTVFAGREVIFEAYKQVGNRRPLTTRTSYGTIKLSSETKISSSSYEKNLLEHRRSDYRFELGSARASTSEGKAASDSLETSPSLDRVLVISASRLFTL